MFIILAKWLFLGTVITVIALRFITKDFKERINPAVYKTAWFWCNAIKLVMMWPVMLLSDKHFQKEVVKIINYSKELPV